MKWLKEYIPYIIIIIIVILIRTFLVTPVRVDGLSMYPTLNNGEILLLNKTKKQYNRMDIVVFNYNKERLIKRVIGLPGESVRIKNNTLYINNKVVKDYTNVKTADFDLTEIGYQTIPDGYLFVMGDNRYNSVDSRLIGLVKIDEIKGKATKRLFPFSKFGNIN